MVNLTKRGLKNIIIYKGLKNLKREEKDNLKLIVDRNYEKIHRLFKNNITNLVIHTKTYGEGKARKFSIHLKAEAPTKIFATEVSDRDLKRATRKALDNIINKIKHTFESKDRKSLKLKLKSFLRMK